MENKMECIGRKYGSDKITHHRYHEIYDSFLKNMYNKNGAMIEIGIQNGYSLNMWLELFPNAMIYGMDIGVEHVGTRFKIFKGDQSNINDLEKMATEIKNNQIFFINDDGSHIPEHQLFTFNYLFPLLEEGGIYIIEDIETSYWTKGGLYGYQTRYGYKHPNSIIEVFKDVVDGVNSEFSGERDYKVKHINLIGSITFSQNCIIITKKTKEKRDYRFREFL